MFTECHGVANFSNSAVTPWKREIFQRIRQENKPEMACFIYLRVFNDAANSSDYIASNDRKGYGKMRP
jgi:hypothetical protein